MLFFNYRKVFKVKKLIYYVLTCAIIASYSTISKAVDSESDELNQEEESHSIIIRAASADSGKLNQEKIVQQPSLIGITQEGERDGVVYVRRSHLRKILLSPPGKHETKGFSDPVLNGFKYVKLNNELGKKEMYIFLYSFEEGDKLRFPKGKKLIPCSFASLFPTISVWGVSVYDYVKRKPSKEKSSRRKHRSKRTKEAAS